jgi:hypothetical protein
MQNRQTEITQSNDPNKQNDNQICKMAQNYTIL